MGLPGWVAWVAIIAIVAAYVLGLRFLRDRARQTQPPQPPGSHLTESELDRYARHILVREIGGSGQMRLRQSNVLVVGAGGLGSPVLLYLAAAGVGQISIVDDDAVDLSNLQRQILHSDDSLGRPKVRSAAYRISALNPLVNVRSVQKRMGKDNADALVADHDLVLDGSDNFETRNIVNAACVRAGKPLIFGAIAQWEGQVALLDSSNRGPCYSCIMPTAPSNVDACSEAGVVGPVPGVIGSMMAVEAVKKLTGAAENESPRLYMFDGLHGQHRTIRISRDPNCQVCMHKHQPPTA